MHEPTLFYAAFLVVATAGAVTVGRSIVLHQTIIVDPLI